MSQKKVRGRPQIYNDEIHRMLREVHLLYILSRTKTKEEKDKHLEAKRLSRRKYVAEHKEELKFIRQNSPRNMMTVAEARKRMAELKAKESGKEVTEGNAEL